MSLSHELVIRARDGDEDAFRVLTQPHRRALLTHCYRMLGSYQAAEDVLQETLLAAWQGLPGFEARASVKTWLYRIATNRSLNLMRAIRSRQPKAWDVPGVAPPSPNAMNEIVWLEPFPDAVAEDAAISPGPDTLLERTQAVSLAFVTALQVLPPRQVAALLLCDVVGFRADEVASMLETSDDAINSALKRARSTLARTRTDRGDKPPQAGSPAEDSTVARFMHAWQAADVKALVTLLTDDVFMSMPPLSFEYHGRDAVARFSAGLFDAGRRFALVATRANGQPAFGAYLLTPQGARPGVGVYVLSLAGERITALTRFERHCLPWFGLPASLDE